MKQLITRWGKHIQKDYVLQEYPRPDFVRDSFYNLNGEWEYAITKEAHVDVYDGKILVPFSPEAALSGVSRIVMPGDYLHYQKKFKVSADFCRGRIFLHFGAVDQECVVYLNGVKLGSHKGGYLPFCFEITKIVRKDENVLALCVTDDTEKKAHARGKQKLKKKGKYKSLFYTPNSGIWKTVWLESTPEQYMKGVRITPDFDNGSIKIDLQAEGCLSEGHIRISENGVAVKELDILVNQEMVVKIHNFHAWSPDTPNLYDVELTYGEDRATTYFGMRKYSTGRDPRGMLRFYLNNEPYFFSGILDQGYWPESLMTPPDDEALIYDIYKMKGLGFNTVRKHIKVESERFYYHCDKIGMIVWQDMPNGGGDYNMGLVTYLPNASNWIARNLKDHWYTALKRTDEIGRRQYYADLEGMVSLLYNHPSIAVWVPFNEGWGQFDAAKATKLIRSMDCSRLINEACGWFDQGGGDMYSIHNYIKKLKISPQKDRVVALTEYGGYSYPVKGHMACKKEFGYRAYQSKEELTQSYQRLWEEELLPNIEKGLCSAIYTQLSDIEEEINGFMTYDREIDKMEEDTIKRLNQKLYKRFRELTGL